MNKLQRLKVILKSMGRVVVAYSGGLDSTFLLKTAVDVLGTDNVFAVTARSETYPLSEYKESVRMAKKIGARQITIHTSELGIKNFSANPVNRCYYCKKELFKKLDAIRKKQKMRYVLDGTNFDDLKDIRHGRKAAQEVGVKSPLLEAGITKADIRKYSKKLKLSTWNKPSFACLASRVPFDTKITKEALGRIEAAEEFIRNLGVRQVRVRIHKDIARIEVGREDFGRVIELGSNISKELKRIGFAYIALDLAGYRTGSMHETKVGSGDRI